MDTKTKVLIDPLKNEVHLPVEFEDVLVSKDTLDKDLSVVILKPAVIIRPNNLQPFLYHARIVGWEVTLLLKSVWQQNYWLVSECLWDEDANIVKNLITKSEWVTFSQR